jgi:phage head maturation protease
MRETSEGLLVPGQLDFEDSSKAREAWRLVKSGAIGLSFGYLVERKRKGGDGANELLELDMFEVSLTPAPVNASARIISWKAKDDDAAERERSRIEHLKLERQLIEEGLITKPASAEHYEHGDPVFTGTGRNGDEQDKALREGISKSFDPIQVARFEC